MLKNFFKILFRKSVRIIGFRGVYECPLSGGFWIPLGAYLAWKERQGPAAPASTEPAPAVADDSKQPARICPESGRLLLRYRVGHGLGFHVDRSPVTGGVWLDRGEWDALKSKGLHVALHLIFTAAYQQQVRSAEYARTLNDTFKQRIGAENFARVEEFARWVERQPEARDICCYLLDSVEPPPAPKPPR